MRRAILFFLFLSGVSNADDPFACVDPDIADAFLGNSYHGRPEYSTVIPDGFVRLNVPQEFSLVGSQMRGSMTTVVYKAGMNADRAMKSAVGALAESGWSENDDRRRPGRRGFQTRSASAATVVCHDDDTGALSVIANDRSGQTFVSYVQHAESQSCGDQPVARPRHDPSEIMSQLPVLKLPDSVKAANTGMGGDGEEVHSHVDISEASGRTELQSYLEDQIRNQRWEYQTRWSSHYSSGSVWTLHTAEDDVFIGTLHVYDSDADPIRVRFSVNPANPTKSSYSGTWSSTSN